MKTRIIPFIFSLALLNSCGKDLPVGEPLSDDVPIRPSAGLNLTVALAGRSALPAGPVSGDRFPNSTEKLFAVTAYKGAAAPTDYSSAYFDDEAVDSDADGKLSFENTQYYPADAGKLYFYAYSPVNTSGYTAGTASAAPTVAWTIDGRQDIMWAKDDTGIGKAGAGATQSQPTFDFKHLLKQVRFKLVKGEGFGDGISATSVKITNCRTAASLNPITGVLTFTGSADQSLGLSGSYAILPAGNAEEIGSLLCEAGETDLDVEVQAAGVTYTTSVSLTSSDNAISAGGAGVSYLVTLTFLGTQIMLGGVAITEWVDAGESSGTIE